MEEQIILIGGIAGTGKTTLSNMLLHYADLHHSVGLGWIREVVCKFFNEKDHPELFTYSFRPVNANMNPYENMLKQSLMLKPYIEVCIQRARREGTSLLLEGVNLVPGVVDAKLVDGHFYLKSPDDINVYRNMIMGAAHKKRIINDVDMCNLKNIEAISIEKCKRASVPVIDFAPNEKRVEQILYHLNRRKKRNVCKNLLR